jgi:hypothetical protein
MRGEIEPAPTVLIKSANPFKLRAFLERERRERRVIIRRPVTEVQPGLWAAEVTVLRRPRPGWVVPAAVVGGVAVVGALVWWIVATITAILAGISVAGVLGAGVLLVLLFRLTAGGRGCETTVTVRHRHHG